MLPSEAQTATDFRFARPARELYVLPCGNLVQVDLSAFDEDRLYSYPESNMCALLHAVPPEFCLP